VIKFGKVKFRIQKDRYSYGTTNSLELGGEMAVRKAFLKAYTFGGFLYTLGVFFTKKPLKAFGNKYLAFSLTVILYIFQFLMNKITINVYFVTSLSLLSI